LIVDVHAHLGRQAEAHQPAGDGETLVRRAQALGITRLAVNGKSYPNLREGNDAVADLAARFPDTVIGFAATNPYQHDMAAEALRCLDGLGFRGVKLHVAHQQALSPRDIVSYTREWDRLFALLSERCLPVLFHGLVTEEMIRAWPDVPFVEAHGIGSVARMERLARYANYHVDTAWSQNTAWCVRAAADLVGVDRVLWGTDAPAADFAQRLGVVLDSGLAEDALRQILGLNAARLLRLPGPAP
jgi:predicted TIM-barrel fold metal-dependent hydrolase